VHAGRALSAERSADPRAIGWPAVDFESADSFSIMTPDQVHLIRSSFDALWPIRGELAEVFYRRFFELAPDARRLFPDDMERQKAKLMDAIATIVGALDQHEVLQSIIIDTGRQHRQIGVQPSHFVAFG
jgi:hemoglobin-like flavoprotein